MQTVHLISGLPCSGKTTYSKRLAAELDAVHFWLDYWLITLYGAYNIDEVGHPEHVRRVLACRELIWAMAVEFLRRGADVILDDGFFLREHREQVVRMAREAGAQAKIHYLNTPVEVLRVRLQGAQRQPAQVQFPDFARPVRLLRGHVRSAVGGRGRGTGCRRVVRRWETRLESLGCPLTRVPLRWAVRTCILRVDRGAWCRIRRASDSPEQYEGMVA